MPEIINEFWRRFIHIKVITAEPIEMAGQIRAERRRQGGRQRVPGLPQVIEEAAERIHVVEDDAVSNQLVVLDEFALLVAVIGGESFVAPEGDPLGKSVEGLALIWLRPE